MSTLESVLRNIRFLKRLYKKKGTVRDLLESDNFKFLEFAHPGHFYSPLPDLTEIYARSEVIFDRSARDLPGIHMNEELQLELLRKFSNLCKDIPFPDNKTEGFRYFFDNSYYSYGDGVILYSFLRYFEPKRVIEVGSGFSSAEMLDIYERFLNKETEFVFVEPYPDRLFGLLSLEDMGRYRVEIKPLQKIARHIFHCLEANDILFIDSSHVAKIDSDILYIMSTILPLLRKGVIIHFHDVLWPFEYPRIWLDDGRAWNEAYFLRAFLQYNAAFEILYFNSFMALHHTETLQKTIPAALKIPSSKVTPGNTSLWIRKVL